ncbi:MAG: ABC transporter substrate-binding protein [Sphaerospermopsis kisseleviana]
MNDRLEFLHKELDKDMDLRKEIESQLRSQRDPREKLRLEGEIERIKKDIAKREEEIEQEELKIKERKKEIKQIKQGIDKDKDEVEGEVILNNKKQFLTRVTPNNRNNLKKIGIGIAAISIAVLSGIVFNKFIFKNSNSICLNGQENRDINLSIYKYFSCGEKALISGSILTDKLEGIKAYKDNNYEKAVEFFKRARIKQPNDPEILIYLNNAIIEGDKMTAYTIAVVVPINSNFYTSVQILRGVAQAQNEFLKENKSRIGLKVLIANDDNNPDRAKEIANFLVKQSHIFAVIGHYASDITLGTRDIYEKGKLVIVTPGSTSTRLPRHQDRFFFRTVPSLKISSISVGRYLENNKYNKVAIFHNPSSEFSKSFFTELKTNFLVYKVNIMNNNEEIDFNLSNPFFEPNKAIEKASERGVQAFIIIPDGGTTSYSIPNALKLIKASYKKFPMVGANTLFSDETLLLGEDVVGHLVITTPWIQTTASQSIFAHQAQELWSGKEIGPWAVTGYDAAKALIKGLFFNDKQDKPTRLKLQETLADPQFEAKGADEQSQIKFEDNGNRQKELVELAKIVESKCSDFGYSFVPEEYNESQIKQLNSNCQ